MVSHIFNLIVYQPLYNGLIFLVDILPGADAGVAVIMFTFLCNINVVYVIDRDQSSMTQHNTTYNKTYRNMCKNGGSC